MEKAKNDFAPRRFLTKRIKIFLGICLLAAFGVGFVMMMIVVQTRSGEFVEKLPLELVAMAEYELNHRMPSPAYLSTSTRVPLDVKEGTEGLTEICAISLDASGLFGTSRFFINGSRLPDELVERSFSLRTFVSNGYEALHPDKSTACVHLPLENGLHLIEFQKSVWEPVPNYQWVLEVKRPFCIPGDETCKKGETR